MLNYFQWDLYQINKLEKKKTREKEKERKDKWERSEKTPDDILASPIELKPLKWEDQRRF